MKGIFRTAEKLLQPGVVLALAALLWLGMAGAAAAAKDTGGKSMDRVQATEKNRAKWQGEGPSPLADTDPELAAMRDRLVYGEILNARSPTGRPLL